MEVTPSPPPTWFDERQKTFGCAWPSKKLPRGDHAEVTPIPPFAEGAAAVLVIFVAPAADVTPGRSVWQPTDTTCLAKTLAYNGFPVTPSTILRASWKEIFRSDPLDFCVVPATVGTFYWIGARGVRMFRRLTTASTDTLSLATFLMVSKLLALETPQRVWYIQLYRA